jgi:hypothetical protein
MIKRKDMVNLTGLMEDATGENGSMGNSTEKEPMLLVLAKKNMESGKKGKE